MTIGQGGFVRFLLLHMLFDLLFRVFLSDEVLVAVVGLTLSEHPPLQP